MGSLSRSRLGPTEGQAKEGGVNLSARRCELTQFLSSATKGEKRGEMVPVTGWAAGESAIVSAKLYVPSASTMYSCLRASFYFFK